MAILGPQLTDSPNEASAAPAPTMRPVDNLMSKWNGWLSDPSNRSALVSFGINMLQPRGPGQSVVGQVGQSIGAGAEARDAARVAQQEQVQQQVENARANRAENRADTQVRQQGELQSAQADYYRVGKSSANDTVSTRIRALNTILDQAKTRVANAETMVQDPDPADIALITQVDAELRQLLGAAGPPGPTTGAVPVGTTPTVAPSGVPSVPGAQAPVTITDDAGFAALPSGTPFIGPDGKKRIKP